MGTDNNKSVEKYKTLTDKLPRITKIEYLLRKYETPQIRYYSGEMVEHDKALELHIQVEWELPATAITPVLFIGDEKIDDYEFVEGKTYRFFCFEPQKLQEGAPIRLGWPDGRCEPEKYEHNFKKPKE